MLYETNKLNLFTFQYGSLVISILFFALTVYPFLLPIPMEISDYSFLFTFLYLVISILALYIFFKLNPKWKIVAFNRMRIVVGLRKNETEYSWLDVQSITLYKFFSTYLLRLKNGEEILFAAYGRTSLLTGDNSEMGVIINKMKRDLNL